MALYDTIDCTFTWDGDYTRGEDGDLGDTSSDYIQSLINEIRTLVKCDFADWEKDPYVAADLSDFKGESNTKETGKKIEERIKSRLVAAKIVQSQDVQVRVVPVHVNQVLIIIRVQAVSTANNSLRPGEPAVVSLIYDSMEQDIFFLPAAQTGKDKIA